MNELDLATVNTNWTKSARPAEEKQGNEKLLVILTRDVIISHL